MHAGPVTLKKGHYVGVHINLPFKKNMFSITFSGKNNKCSRNSPWPARPWFWHLPLTWTPAVKCLMHFRVLAETVAVILKICHLFSFPGPKLKGHRAGGLSQACDVTFLTVNTWLKQFSDMRKMRLNVSNTQQQTQRQHYEFKQNNRPTKELPPSPKKITKYKIMKWKWHASKSLLDLIKCHFWNILIIFVLEFGVYYIILLR